MRFLKKSIVIEATQWFKNGDHPDDNCVPVRLRETFDPDDIRKHTGELVQDPVSGEAYFLCEGAVVRYFRRPDVSGDKSCQFCNRIMNDHGWIDTLEGGHIVCPGDWVITGVK